MKIQLRLEHLLGLDQKEHVSLSSMADAMNIGRHQLMHLLDHDAKQINRETLDKVCEYLVGHGGVTRNELAQNLLKIEPESFWPMLAARQRIDFYMGVRWPKQMGLGEQVVAADAILQSVIVNRLTGVAAEGIEEGRLLDRHAQQVIDSKLAVSWGAYGATDREIQSEATGFFKRFLREPDDKSIVCLGSNKSNALCCNVVAHGFRRAKAFQSEDEAQRNADRSVPFFMMYREDDPHPDSCWGGVRLSREDRRRKPGIYFEAEPGVWECAPSTAREDAALVFYRYHKTRQNLEMVLGGFSGRATRCLADMLREGKADSQLWPPAIDTNRLRIGAFIVKFWFRPPRQAERIRARAHQRRTRTEVIAVPADVLVHRISSPRD